MLETFANETLYALSRTSFGDDYSLCKKIHCKRLAVTAYISDDSHIHL